MAPPGQWGEGMLSFLGSYNATMPANPTVVYEVGGYSKLAFVLLY